MSSFSKWRRKAGPGPRCRWVPAGLAMNGESGECLAELDAELAILETFVTRSQCRHYARLSRADALALYPALAALASRSQRSARLGPSPATRHESVPSG